MKKSKKESVEKSKPSVYCEDVYIAFAPREMKPFRAFALLGMGAWEPDAKQKFKNWLSYYFPQFVWETCLFTNERNETYVKCIDGNTAFTKGKIVVSRFEEDYVYLKLEGCDLPYRVQLDDFLMKYRYANDEEEQLCENPKYHE